MGDYSLVILFVGIVLTVLILFSIFSRVTIFEYERGVLFERGKYKAVLGPGEHYLISLIQKLQRVDVRLHHVTLTGQEVLTMDNIGLKLSIVLGFRVSDPRIALTSVVSYENALYLEMQLILRDLIGQKNVDDLLAARQVVSDSLMEKGSARAATLGLELISAGIKDIMFPGELKTIYSQVVNARKEGLAALERARGEQAALRNLANAAQLLENNPGLMKLRILQALSSSAGNTIVLEMGESVSAPTVKG